MNQMPYWEILAYDNPLERQKWQTICDSFEDIDIFFFPEYAHLFELHGDGKPYLFVYHQSESDLAIYPFLKRPIGELDNFHTTIADYFDIASPYGYGGYLRNSSNVNMEIFANYFNNYCQSQHIVSEFIRFHPIINNALYAPQDIKITPSRETVTIDLTNDSNTIWKDFEPTCRNKIRKAINNNIKIVRDDNYDNLKNFYELYIKTMHRLKAHKYYNFSENWFNSLRRLLNNNNALFHAYYKNNIINSAIFIFCRSYIHYFLSGSLFEMRQLAGNNLLLYEVALWAKQQGFKYLHLGGGYQPNDSLSCFKSSFSSKKTKYCISGVIHRSDDYNYLCKLRFPSGEFQGSDIFFPLYRFPQ
ncbi:MAG TPA: hypothetical protein DCY27_00965 [Desulfobacterales bacterium]|nr:hypothetical protein [Desulfobacterales bacterium]